MTTGYIITVRRVELFKEGETRKIVDERWSFFFPVRLRQDTPYRTTRNSRPGLFIYSG